MPLQSADPARNRRVAAKAATRAKVLAAARKLWAEPGTYEAVTIRILADAIGMSVGAIFSNFGSKADLWREAMGYEPPVDSAEVREALKAVAAWGAQLDRAA